MLSIRDDIRKRFEWLEKSCDRKDYRQMNAYSYPLMIEVNPNSVKVSIKSFGIAEIIVFYEPENVSLIRISTRDKSRTSADWKSPWNSNDPNEILKFKSFDEFVSAVSK